MAGGGDARHEAPLRAGLAAGAVAAVAASLLSLPLHSPHDGLLNSASVTCAALAAGAAVGAVWRALRTSPVRLPLFAIVLLCGLALTVSAAGMAETQVERAVSFGLPIALVVGVVIGALVPLLAARPRLLRTWAVALAVAAALVVGAALASVGDQPSGDLELPPRAAAPSGHVSQPGARPF